MTKWIEPMEAAEVLGVTLPVLKRLARSSKNPPPFVRPSERSMLFDREALARWQSTWKANQTA